MNNRQSHYLYSSLAERALHEGKINETPHELQFQVNSNSAKYYKELYLDQQEFFSKFQTVNEHPNDDTCRSCKQHFLNKRPVISHLQDIQSGNNLEEIFENFINDYFEEKNLPFFCCRADKERKNMPDFVIKSKSCETDIFYFEFKCIFKPFIKVNSKIPNYQCYSHSLTLDCDEKLARQFELIESKKIMNRTAFVYWYDIPCIKGVFWNWAQDVKHLWNESPSYSREITQGDYQNGRKTGHTDKIYLALPLLNDFYSLFSTINLIAKNEIHVL